MTIYYNCRSTENSLCVMYIITKVKRKKFMRTAAVLVSQTAVDKWKFCLRCCWGSWRRKNSFWRCCCCSYYICSCCSFWMRNSSYMCCCKHSSQSCLWEFYKSRLAMASSAGQCAFPVTWIWRPICSGVSSRSLRGIMTEWIFSLWRICMNG